MGRHQRARGIIPKVVFTESSMNASLFVVFTSPLVGEVGRAEGVDGRGPGGSACSTARICRTARSPPAALPRSQTPAR
jgi:hypothetical protein